MILQLKKRLADLYLFQMNVTRDYFSVIIILRIGEYPEEQQNRIYDF
ncbi:hypothetical protein [Tissierella praeacuta]